MIETLTINELFSGIGSQVKALDRLNINYKTVGICEIDKYAIQSYEAIHGPTRNYGDISKAERLDYADIWTYSFPCQDLSVAGKQKGINEGTRSGLLYEVQRLLEVAKKEGSLPKYLLLENVKNLVGKKFKQDFDKWLNFLDDLGYMNYWQVLNAKDYGIPQNRERVFVVSIRKDLKQGYIFPEKQELKIKLKDVLETNVDEKYYLSEKIVNGFLAKMERGRENPNGFNRDINIRDKEDISTTITARYHKCGITDPYIAEPLIGASRGRNPDNPSDRTVGAPTEQRLEINYNGVSNTLTSVQKDNYVIEPKIVDDIYNSRNPREYEKYSPTLRSERFGLKVIEPLKIIDNTKKGYTEANEYDSINLEQPNSKTRRGRVGKQISNTLMCSCNMAVVEPKILQVGNIIETERMGGNPNSGRIYSPEGISPCITTMQGGGLEPKILTHIIPQKVSVRKYEVDTNKLVEVLREHKQKTGLTNNKLAECLNIPVTKVEHWFRTDECFSIPDSEVWFKLKDLLDITTDEFDLAITEFEEKDGVFEKSNRCYHEDGISPTLTATAADEKIITNYRIRKLTPLECWRLMGFDDEDCIKAQNVGISNTQLYKQAGNSIVVNVLEAIFKNLFIDVTELKEETKQFELF